MKYCYRFHYGDYAIGENEQLYEQMAQRGWQLVSRGAYLSKFKAAPRQNLHYRIELSSPAMLDAMLDGNSALPDEQIALYEDCGWELVARCGLVHVFSAPQSSDAPELYTDPRQQADTLKALRRNYRSCWWSTGLIIGIHLLLAFSVARHPDHVFPNIWASIIVAAFRSTQLLMLYVSVLVYEVYHALYGGIRTAILYHRLKAGKPLNHAPAKRVIYNTVSALLIACCIFFGASLLIQIHNVQKNELPMHSTEPYLLLGDDLGWESERNSMFWQDEESSQLETVQSFLAQMWNTHECVGSSALSNSAWIYQDIYRVRDTRMIPTLVQALMYDSTFADDPEEFRELQIDGLDAAYTCGLDGIAVRGNLVYYISYSESCTAEMFNALAAKHID